MSDADTTDATTTILGAAVGGGNGPLQAVAYCVMGTIIAVGSIGNCIVLNVYARKTDGHAANIFIISLAVSDLIACSLVIPMTIAMEVNSYVSNEFVCKLYYVVNCSGIPFSSMLMTAIAVERYFCICRPFLRAITVTRAKAIVLILGAIAFTLGLIITTICSLVVKRRVDGNGTAATVTLEHASYGECREISDVKNDAAFPNSTINISEASLKFYHVFQMLHLSLFGLCILLVFALYVKIYESVLRLRQRRRDRRQNRQNRMQLMPVVGGSDEAGRQHQGNHHGGCVADIGVAADEADASNGDPAAPEPEQQRLRMEEPPPPTSPPHQPQHQPQHQLQHQPQHQHRRKSLRLVKDSDALQNLKTAAMLFVVTIVFTATFIPAALMTLKRMQFNILIFYLYYLSHATNPLIYCFMNRNFRDDLRRIFCPAGAQQHQQQQQLLLQDQPQTTAAGTAAAARHHRRSSAAAGH